MPQGDKTQEEEEEEEKEEGAISKAQQVVKFGGKN